MYELLDATTIRITELPVKKWTQDYKEFLEGMISPTDKIKEPFVKVASFHFCPILQYGILVGFMKLLGLLFI